MTKHLCVHATIHGTVQGVGYRSWAERKAIEYGLTGWVKNRKNGTVEAVFCGPQSAVEDMLAQCEEGPLRARVTKIERTIPETAAPADFRQLATD